MLEIKKRTTPHYPKNYFYALMLCCFLGMFGIHRFYTGYKRIGFIQLLTLGGFGVWWIVDLISMCFNSYKDKYGIEMEEYNGTLAGLVLTGFVIVLLAVACLTFIPAMVDKMV